MLSLDDDIGGALKKACSHDRDEDAMHLVRAAKVVRREMFKHTFSFDGWFTAKCQESVIPHSLLALIKMISR